MGGRGRRREGTLPLRSRRKSQPRRRQPDVFTMRESLWLPAVQHREIADAQIRQVAPLGIGNDGADLDAVDGNSKRRPWSGFLGLNRPKRRVEQGCGNRNRTQSRPISPPAAGSRHSLGERTKFGHLCHLPLMFGRVIALELHSNRCDGQRTRPCEGPTKAPPGYSSRLSEHR